MGSPPRGESLILGAGMRTLPGACFDLFTGVIPWAEERGIEVEPRIVTNGILFTEKVVDKLTEYGRIHVQIALDGPKEVHDRRRIYKDGRGTFDVIMNALKLLKDAEHYLSLCVNIDKDNINSIEKLIDTLKEQGLQDVPIGFSPIFPMTEACKSYEAFCLKKEDYILASRLWSMAERKGMRLTISQFERGWTYCETSTKEYYTIDPFRDVYKCWDMIGLKKHRVGFINEKGEFVQEYPYYELLSRDPLNIEPCKEWKLLPICCGGCVAKALMSYGSYHKPGCHGERFVTKEIIRDFLEIQCPEIFCNEISP